MVVSSVVFAMSFPTPQESSSVVVQMKVPVVVAPLVKVVHRGAAEQEGIALLVDCKV